MRAFTAMVKKEWLEQLRTYKLLILGLTFLLFGMMNPLTAKLTPQLLKNFAQEGMVLRIPEPVMLDSWVQFFKNVPQMGLIVVVILFCQTISGEMEKGTLLNLLTKGLPRRTVLLAKFTAAGSSFTAAYWMCFLVSYGYSVYFWRMDLVVGRIVLAAAGAWLFGLMLLAAGLLGGVIFSGSYGSLLFTGVLVAAQFLAGIVPEIKKYLPVGLVTDNVALLTGAVTTKAFLISAGAGLFATALLLAGAVVVFGKKEL